MEYNIKEIINDTFNYLNIPIYKEEIELVKGIIHLRKICPASYKRTAIAKILTGKSTNYTKDPYYGFALKNKLWTNKQNLNDIIDIILDPLYDDNENYDFESEMEEYMQMNLTTDNIKLYLVEKQLDKIIKNYQNNPNIQANTNKKQLPNIKATKLFSTKKYLSEFEKGILNFIQNNIDNTCKSISFLGLCTYDQLEFKTDNNKIIVLIHKKTKNSENTRNYTYNSNIYTVDIKTKQFYYYSITFSYDENMNFVSTTFKKVKDVELKDNNFFSEYIRSEFECLCDGTYRLKNITYPNLSIFNCSIQGNQIILNISCKEDFNKLLTKLNEHIYCIIN